MAAWIGVPASVTVHLPHTGGSTATVRAVCDPATLCVSGNDMGTVEAGRDWQSWLASTLRHGVPPSLLEPSQVPVVLAAARSHGITALLAARLAHAEARAMLPGQFLDHLMSDAHAAAAQWMLRERELTRLGEAFASHGFQVLVLKGSALCMWLYPQRHLRSGGDIDLLFASREASERAAALLSTLGYVLAFMPGSMHHEMTTRLIVDGVSRSELDLHCKLVNAPAYADLLTFAELWDGSIELPGMPVSLRALKAPHALLHACLNRALDMQNAIPDRLKLLYDVRLFAERMDDRAWLEFQSLAHARQVSGICRRTLGDGMHLSGAAVPDSVMLGLAAQDGAEPIDPRRLDDWRYMFWRHLKALPGLAARMRWLMQGLFPNRDQLRELHGQGSWMTLMWRRLRRGASRLG